MTTERMDYFGATASCEVRYLANGNHPSVAIPIAFTSASRGCASVPFFDQDRNREILKLRSLLTYFHADDNRPQWAAFLARVVGNDPARIAGLPRPINALAASLMQRYGPGDITVYQDENRPVVGEVIAANN